MATPRKAAEADAPAPKADTRVLTRNTTVAYPDDATKWETYTAGTKFSDIPEWARAVIEQNPVLCPPGS